MIRENNLREYDSYRLRGIKDQRTARISLTVSRLAGAS